MLKRGDRVVHARTSGRISGKVKRVMVEVEVDGLGQHMNPMTYEIDSLALETHFPPMEGKPSVSSAATNLIDKLNALNDLAIERAHQRKYRLLENGPRAVRLLVHWALAAARGALAVGRVHPRQGRLGRPPSPPS